MMVTMRRRRRRRGRRRRGRRTRRRRPIIGNRVTLTVYNSRNNGERFTVSTGEGKSLTVREREKERERETLTLTLKSQNHLQVPCAALATRQIQERIWLG